MTRCPYSYIDTDLASAIQLADLFEKGIPPVAGGVLDQAKQFIDFCRQHWADNQRFK